MNSPKPKITNLQIFKAFWQGVKPTAWLYALWLTLHAVGSIVGIIIPLYYKKFFDIVSQAGGKDAIAASLIQIISIVFILHIVSWLSFQSGFFLYHRILSKTLAWLKQNAFDYLLHHSHEFFVNSFTGSLVQRIGRFSRAFESIADIIGLEVLPMIIMIAGSIIVTWTLAPVISLVIALWVIFFFSFNFFYAKWVYKYNLASAAADSKTSAALSDSVSNHPSITTFTGHDYEQKYIKEVTENQSRLLRITWNMYQYSYAVQALLLFVVEFAVFYYAIKFWQHGLITVGTFVLAQVYIIGVGNRLWGLGRMIRVFYVALADSREMIEIMRKPHGIVDISAARNLQVKEAKVVFDNVAFIYGEDKGQSKEVIRDFNLTIKTGEKVALIGPSGAGKTTVTKLLLRLYDISAGNILIDGQNIREVTQESLRKNISLVPQDPILFHRSLMENIRYGKRTATDEEVIRAAKLAHCDEFIDVLPNKYETLVGERGVKLSGGERQRVAIARAILKNAPILILDEATSSLDSHSESLIQEALDTLMRGRTTIVIAHRLSTIRKMDRIIVMENGAIREEGTHSSLIKNDSSLYKKLWDLQAGGFVVDQ